MPMTCVFNGCLAPTMTYSDKCSFHRYRSKCQVQDCFNQVYARSLCVGHGGKKHCAFDGCATTVRTGDFCAKHSRKAKPLCSEPGCERAAHQWTKCTHHGGGKPCSIAGCALPARISGVCWPHRNRVLPEPAFSNETDGDALILMLDEWMKDEPLMALDDDDVDFHGILDDILLSM
ncbi:hypothetical protein SPRG_10112 [Saprolegnia parasitica CBS 223.65]|uniref:Uncharacterized protein n=1 Tax=Saprolegnia parasitica (strain CBS 223.65) TaxID=695850 RepID=A0A067CDF2_SAPPC|nr:hypothetical protein SPRG_10112 [Saprolegnia parasitica CBS 223.65]KDO24581.1 hypothetical protein SPRG_10112 [Saprolegnia parasitica CBS 223.65]|eukprot:XP_012204649.1 hypothetical protein SPRG_10112 [Saprolegnia parasitica CBS 223.65]